MIDMRGKKGKWKMLVWDHPGDGQPLWYVLGLDTLDSLLQSRVFFTIKSTVWEVQGSCLKVTVVKLSE